MLQPADAPLLRRPGFDTVPIEAMDSNYTAQTVRLDLG